MTNLVLLIQCPYCRTKFGTERIISARCPNTECGAKFQIYPKHKPSRILRITNSTIPQLLRIRQKQTKNLRIGENP
jgi:hypothetical protein